MSKVEKYLWDEMGINLNDEGKAKKWDILPDVLRKAIDIARDEEAEEYISRLRKIKDSNSGEVTMRAFLHCLIQKDFKSVDEVLNEKPDTQEM